MEATNWAPEHSDALREFLARGMTFSEIAKAINSKFKTAYSRNATLGRAKRMGLGRPVRPESLPQVKPQLNRLGELRPVEPRTSKFHWSPPAFEEAEPLNLRCVEIEPRHLSLINWSAAIADIPTAEMPRAKPLLSAVIQDGPAPATAHRIFI
jgi:GcrA cell cycle regulator